MLHSVLLSMGAKPDQSFTAVKPLRALKGLISIRSVLRHVLLWSGVFRLPHAKQAQSSKRRTAAAP